MLEYCKVLLSFLKTWSTSATGYNNERPTGLDGHLIIIAQRWTHQEVSCLYFLKASVWSLYFYPRLFWLTSIHKKIGGRGQEFEESQIIYINGTFFKSLNGHQRHRISSPRLHLNSNHIWKPSKIIGKLFLLLYTLRTVVI